MRIIQDSNDSFITRTIVGTGEYLAGERAAEQAEVWQAEARDASGWTLAEREQYNELLDADDRDWWNDYLAHHCQVHDQELQAGKCSACVAEEEQENRDDH